MTRTLALMAVFANWNQVANAARSPKPFEVAHVCGRLFRLKQVPVKNTGNSFRDKRQAIPHATLMVYVAQQRSECCSGSPVEKTQSGRRGQFRFKHLKASLLWLVARVDDRDYKMLIRIDSKKNTDDECSDLEYDIDDSGSFTGARTITVN
jgi:hypothetical protein